MKWFPGWFFLAIFCLFSAAQAAPQQTAPPEQAPTIRQTVQEILLDVVVRDSRGRVVKNLKPTDLEIYEDGVKQEIRSFQFVPGHDIVAKGKTAVPKAAAASSNPLKAINLICIVFANLDAYNKKYAVDAVKEFIKNQFEPDTWIAVFNLESQLSVLHPFTTNRQEILDAANKAFTGTGVDFAQVATAVLNATPVSATIEVTQVGDPAHGGTVTATQRISGGELNPAAITGADVSNSQSANIQRGDLASQHRQFGGIEGMRQMDQIEAMVRQLGTLPGRKSVLFLSPGLATTGDPDQFKSMVDKANKAGVTFYAIDVNGLSADIDQSQASSTALSHAAAVSSTQASRGGSAGQNMEKMRQGDYVADAVRTTDTQATMRALSEATGGFLVGSTNDLRKPFARILEDVDTHYEVIYKPASDHFDGRLRKIDVKVDRPELTVESQEGYFALPALGPSPELSPSETLGLATLNMEKPPHAFEFQAAAYQFRPGVAGSQNDAVFEIPAASLQATPEPAAKRGRMHLSLLALVKDSSGQVVDKFSQDSPYEIPEENLVKIRSTSISFAHPLTLPPGHYTLETAVLDRESNRASTSKVAFESHERKGVGLSSVTLVQHMEPVNGKVDGSNPFEFQPTPTQGQRVVPELTTSLSATATPYAYFVVYPDPSIADKPKIRAEFLIGGQVAAKQDADLPPPDATGAIPMVINTAAKPGNCELRITAIQGGSSMQQSLKYSIAAK
ncbi:MAG TPA: VWA domain-containing protein [Bryobacteraceae bacterium]|nr:VWA domain-containing protein [Bryobacteraceae bacterium]